MPTVNHTAKLASSIVTLLKAHANLTALIGAGATRAVPWDIGAYDYGAGGTTSTLTTGTLNIVGP